MRVKSCPVKIKAAGTHEGTDDGVFEALVAVFGNVDSTGDKIIPGAFADTLKSWESSGDPIPVYWSHRMDDPDMNIGHVLEAKEIDDGLWIKAQLDLESPKALSTYRLLKGRRVTQFSFAYDIDEYAWVEERDEEFLELRKLQLHEVGPTPIGANQSTELLDVKSGDGRLLQVVINNAHPADSDAIRSAVTKALHVPAVKAGRVLSAKNESALNSALGKITDGTADIQSVLSTLQDDEKATPDRPATSEEPTRAKGDAPALPGTASVRLLTDLASLEAEVLPLTG